MKKILSPLITAILMISSFAALFVGQAPSAYASPDGALSQRFEASGHYEIVSAGIGLDGTTSGTIDLDVPGNVVEAYLYWAGYVARPSDEPLPNPDDYAQITLTVDANLPVSIEADDHHGPDYWFGTDPEHYHLVFVERVAGAGVATPLVEAGSHSYTIEGINFHEPYGAGLMVVYEDELLPISYVSIMDGLDSFYQDYEAPRGPDSEATYFDFSADSTERTAQVTLFAGGVQHPDDVLRPNAIWAQAGTGTKPGSLIDAGGTELDGPPAPYPLGSSNGRQWDTYTHSVTVPSGDNWLGLQIESVLDVPGEIGCEAMFIAAGLVIPSIPLDSHCTNTGDYSVCTDKDDYAPGETVHISGSGFAADAELTIKVIRPNGSTVTGDGSFGPWPTSYDTVTTNGEGNFQYDYALNGIGGEYEIQVLDGPWDGYLYWYTVLATHTFYDVAVAWPTTWEVPPGCVCDISDESPSEIDLLGCPAIFYHFDSATFDSATPGYAYFRERIEGNPIQTNGTFKNSSWVVLFDNDADGAYEVLVSLNGKPASAADEAVELWTNAGTTTLVWDPIVNDPADTLRVSYPVSTHAQVTPTGTAYFVDWAIPLADLATWGVADASTPVYFATSQDSNNFNKDHPECYGCPYPPVADAGSDQSDCEDTDGTTTFSLSGNSTGPGTYRYDWSTTDAGVTINSPNLQNTTVDITGNGTFLITLKVTDDGDTICYDYDDVALTIYDEPTCNLTCDPEGCADCEEVTVTEDGGDAVSWDWSESTASGTDVDGVFTATSSGTVKVIITDANGCTSTCQAEVTIYDEPNCNLTCDPEGCADCEEVVVTEDGGDAVSWDWSESTASGTDVDGVFTATSSGTVKVIITDANGCTSTCQTEVTIYDEPTCEANSNTPVCEGDTINLTGGPDGFEYSWTGPDGFSSTEQNPSISNATQAMEGTYTLTVTDAITGCESECTTDVVVEVCGTTTGGNGGGGGTCSLTVDMQGKEETVKVYCCDGATVNYSIATDPDEVHFLELYRDTMVSCEGCGTYPRIIVMSVAEDPPPPPDGQVFVGPVFDFTGYSRRNMDENSICDSVIFGKPVALLLNYNPAELPDDVASVYMAYFNEESGMWEPIPELAADLGIVAGIGEEVGMISHFSQIGILAELPSLSPDEPPPPPPAEPTTSPPTPPPARFVSSGLGIAPSKEAVGVGQSFIFILRSGERVVVSADIANTGGEGGTYLADLKINGDTYETREITLDAGAGETIVFSIAGLKPGRYTVELAGLSGEFQTSVWYNGWLIAGIATGVGLLCWVAWYLGYYRRRRV